MSTVADITTEATVESEARALIGLYAQRIALTKALATSDSPTASMVDEVTAKGYELDAACEVFRRRHYPRRARVVVGLYSVLAVSPTARRVERVLDLSAEYSR